MTSKDFAKLKVVLDTSVCVSALLSSTGASARILRAVLTRQVHNVITEDVLEEIRGVLGRKKFGLEREKQKTFVRLLIEASLLMNPLEEFKVTRCRDPQDDIFLSLANQAGADYIISLDRDLIELNQIGITKIVDPAAFLKQERVP